MANSCDICGKGVKSGKSVTFSHKGVNRTFKPNVHKVRAIVDGSPKSINVCTKCLKSGRVQKA
ncbi:MULTISPECIES: 50S ribosomal protein L28 [Anaerococcus]|uniref:Large ribosomal subunit protein bL28 n=1 Tax=Anaerococcus nagyae TaxID=1755241 RepID=A0A3E2TJK5_9FIRM|nr:MULTISPECIES: 50S ribosomal protein L28 [Anaerococcus]MDU2591566.1 50S ribosomal protein L28 [Paeniclostridium sordellii]MBP2069331.1 large subunit ribosomal protein L28 [Anaerococcus nagyae]MDU1828519.1 50S ribosomal protein L28 [Anaerococcus sp.]MDU1865050.1 50S ribosomal protein L28 [Anaerococcus sp.]MDU2354352.1 50S ribosomal protein L28 [Anaerococcus sp.]